MAVPSLFRKILSVAVLFFVADAGVFHALRHGMDKYYGFDKEAEVLLVGHSHTVLGLDAKKMEQELKVPVAKYATAGANVLDRYWMLQHYISTHPGVNLVVYDVDPRIFDSEGLSSSSYTLFLPYLDNAFMAEFLKKEATWQEYYGGKLVRTTRFRDQTLNIALRGLLDKVENKKSGVLRMEDYGNYLEHEKERKIKINQESKRYFYDTVEYLERNGIKLILLFIPVAKPLNSIDIKTQNEVVGIFKEVANSYMSVKYIDYNSEFEDRTDLFYDLRHLNAGGNEIITGRLVEDLRNLYPVE